MRVTIKKNKTQSVSAYFKDVVETQSKDILEDMAFYLVHVSPVWSGAYVTSHSIVPKGSGAGRMRKSRAGEPTTEAAAKQEALALLRGDISKLDVVESGGAVIRNRSPHSLGVEYGSPPARERYRPYGKLKAKFSRG